MARRRLLLLLKQPLETFSAITNPKVRHHFEDRNNVHKRAIKYCQEVLRRKTVDWDTQFHTDISQPISNVDLVVTLGGDGTLLRASRYLDDTIPVLGVNSDPTRDAEVDELKDEFDASRSAGYLCAATLDNFEQVLDSILDSRFSPSEISRMAVSVNSQLLQTHALNDLLIAHPCPAAVSRFSFRFRNNDQSESSSVHCRSSGFRVSTAAGSTAAMLSSGGLVMPILSKDLQYMVREPIPSRATSSSLMHGWVRSSQSMEIIWSTKEGFIYIDGCHIAHPLGYGDVVKLTSKAPVLKIFLPPRLLTTNGLAHL